MSWKDELHKRFGGFWNTFFLLMVLVICLRFSGAEWKLKALETRLLYALYLFLSVVVLGVVFAIARVGISRLNKPRYATLSTVPADVAWGLKYGVGCGAALVFTVGLLMVDDYLGPFKEFIDIVIKKIADKFP